MHTVALIIAAAVGLILLGGWIIAAGQTLAHGRYEPIDPFTMMARSTGLAVQDPVDYSTGY